MCHKCSSKCWIHLKIVLFQNENESILQMWCTKNVTILTLKKWFWIMLNNLISIEPYQSRNWVMNEDLKQWIQIFFFLLKGMTVNNIHLQWGSTEIYLYTYRRLFFVNLPNTSKYKLVLRYLYCISHLAFIFLF
jgi:hypothetical protein